MGWRWNRRGQAGRRDSRWYFPWDWERDLMFLGDGYGYDTRDGSHYPEVSNMLYKKGGKADSFYFGYLGRYKYGAVDELDTGYGLMMPWKQLCTTWITSSNAVTFKVVSSTVCRLHNEQVVIQHPYTLDRDIREHKDGRCML